MITEQPLLLLKPQRKPFCIIIFQSETCCKATLVKRYFSGKVSCHAIELFIDYEHRCLASCKLHNNFLQISCCEFEYFSMNKPYTSRRRQRNERTKSQNELAWIYSAFMKISTSTTEYVPLRSVLRGSICHFPSNLLRQLHVVQPPSSDSSFQMRNSICFREFELDYGYLINVCLRKLAEEK